MYDAIATLADIILVPCAVLLPVCFIGQALARRQRIKPPDRPVARTSELIEEAAAVECGYARIADYVRHAGGNTA